MRLNRKSRVAPPTQPTSVTSITSDPLHSRAEGADILYEAEMHWLAMDRFRRDRLRCKKFAFGDQWSDIIEIDGRKVSEEQYLREQHLMPLKNNLILRMLHSVIGVFHSQSREPICYARDRDEQRYGETMSTVLQCCMQLNKMAEINALSLEEFLISGFVVHRKWYGWRDGKRDCWTDVVQPDCFFIDNRMRDPRGLDASLIGEIHDVSIDALVSRLARRPADEKRIREIYANAGRRSALASWHSDFGHPVQDSWDFYVPQDPALCRVIEVWRKETRPRYRCWDINSGEIFKCETAEKASLVDAENDRRLAEARRLGIPDEEVPLIEAEWFVDQFWRHYLLSPFGDVLESGETPYDHGSHPYVFRAYPFIDGEIHSYVSNIIDQQKYINRLITMYDWIMRSSSKGTLMVPENTLPTVQSAEDFFDNWSRVDGVVFYRPDAKTGATPHQISGNHTNIGIDGLLNLQMKFFEDISGVNGAIQGKPGFSGMSAALYSQQTQNATTSLLHILEAFSSFIEDGALKDVKNIQQFYDRPRVFNIAGSSAEIVEYDPQKIRDVEFDLSVRNSTSTPAYRAIANDFLIQLWQNQAISVEQLLECGDFPFSDRLLQSIRTRQQQEAPQPPEGGASDAPAPLGGDFGLKVAP